MKMPYMTLRDIFAAVALQGMCANPDISSAAAKKGLYGAKLHPSYAQSCYALADAMLKERED